MDEIVAPHGERIISDAAKKEPTARALLDVITLHKTFQLLGHEVSIRSPIIHFGRDRGAFKLRSNSGRSCSRICDPARLCPTMHERLEPIHMSWSAVGNAALFRAVIHRYNLGLCGGINDSQVVEKKGCDQLITGTVLSSTFTATVLSNSSGSQAERRSRSIGIGFGCALFQVLQ